MQFDPVQAADSRTSTIAFRLCRRGNETARVDVKASVPVNNNNLRSGLRG